MRKMLLSLLSRLAGVLRAVYCWLFLICAFCAAAGSVGYAVELTRTHSVDKGGIFGVACVATYTLVFGIAWWLEFRRQPSARRWSLAASVILCAPHIPFLCVGAWQAFWKAEYDWLPFLPFGALSLAAFIAPDHEVQIATDATHPNFLRRSEVQIALKIGRATYGWLFFACGGFALYDLVLAGVRILAQQSTDFVSCAVELTYATILGVAWWKIIGNKPAARRWAIAASCLLSVPYFAFFSLGGGIHPSWVGNAEVILQLSFALLALPLFSLPITSRKDDLQVVEN